MTTWSMTFPPPAPLLTMNDRLHWRQRAAIVKAWRHAAALYAPNGTHYHPLSTVSIIIDVPDRRRRDPHNWYPTLKACIDGLVDAGCWPDDTPDWVRTSEPSFRVVKRGDRRTVTLTITEVDG